MSVTINIRHLENGPVSVAGEVPSGELDLEKIDELIHPASNLAYNVTATREQNGLLLQGELEMSFRCECARCLREFDLPVVLDGWTVLLPWSGEDKVPLQGDCVDLTSYFREDMVLALPQRPLCQPECSGLPTSPADFPGRSHTANPSTEGQSAWRELDNLNL
jgi:uncharacterized protein